MRRRVIVDDARLYDLGAPVTWHHAIMEDIAATQMVVQVPMGISTDDLSLRHRLEELLEQALSVDEVGMVDGGDIGSGTMNVFALVTTDRWADALAAAVKVLRELDVDEVAVVARRDLADEDSMPTIVWPDGSTREFTYW
jgi:hypothetical protein